MRIINAAVYADGAFHNGSLYTDEGLFASASADGCLLDAEGCYAIPGLIDMHLHGCRGADASDGDPAALRAIAEYELTRGVTCFLPATMSLPYRQLTDICRSAASFSRRQAAEPRAALREAAFAGLYLEGPFLAAEKCGAQDPANLLPPDAALLAVLQQAAGGLLRVCAVAPELPGALEFIRRTSAGIRLALAHTNADYDTARAAFDAGVAQVTHLFNAMPPFAHRAPGVVGAAFDARQVVCELIADGVHVHPSALRAAYAMFGEHRLLLISDSMRATGLKDGRYTLGGQTVQVSGHRAVLAQKGVLAGSVTDLLGCLQYAAGPAGLPLAGAVRCATENPARALGLFGRRGSLEVGKEADLVLLRSDLSLFHVIRHGEIAL